jgi:ACGX-repeat protein
MILKNGGEVDMIKGWVEDDKTTGTSCGSACGSENKPTSCGSSCGASK